MHQLPRDIPYVVYFQSLKPYLDHHKLQVISLIICKP